MLTITLVIKIANAVENIAPPGISNTSKVLLRPRTTRDETIIPRMPMPEIGLAEVPIRPAMYPQAAATKKPMSSATRIPVNT